MQLPKLKTKKISEFLKKLPKVLAEKAFLTFLILFFLALILGLSVFYKYDILAKRAELKITEKPLQFQEQTYQDILKVWQEREKEFKETDLKTYSDPFR